MPYILATAPIVVALFPWGDFQGHTHWAKVGWVPFVSPPIRIRDIVANLLLFAPLGGVIGWRNRRRTALWLAALTCTGVSLAGEWTQLYSHSRFPSATDLVCNVAGGLLAAWWISSRRRRAAARTPGTIE